MKKWKCTVCGYVHTGDEPPEKCPVCGADKSMFILLESDPESDETSATSTAATSGNSTGRWRCTVCGYIHEGDEPPEKCPVCGADKSLFVPVENSAEENAAPEQETPRQNESSKATPSSSIISRLQHLLGQPPYQQYAQRLTQLHGHPMAVHIPNGLLPISILFTLLAMTFESEGFAIAARYNMYIVALAMPLVVATGIVDWINRFNGHMTSIFKAKMICAAAVTLLSIIIAIWWISAPDLFTKGLWSNFLFLLFNFANLAAAILAGAYGGKLVFRY